MKRPFRAKSVAESLNAPQKEGALKTLLAEAKTFSSISECIHQYLPDDCAAHCKVGSISNQILTIYADSPAWSNRLRYLSSQLLADLRANKFPSLISIEIKVRP